MEKGRSLHTQDLKVEQEGEDHAFCGLSDACLVASVHSDRSLHSRRVLSDAVQDACLVTPLLIF